MQFSTLTYIIIFTLASGMLSLLLASSILVNKKLSSAVAQYGMPFAAGALLATVFLDLFVEGLHDNDTQQVMVSALIGIIVFFMAERFIRWFHHHHQHEEEGKDPTVPLLITGDVIHNILDGVAIAAAFLVSIPVGIVTALAVAAHELPKEIGEFAALLGKGMSRSRVLIANAFSSLSAVAAGILTYFIGQTNTLPLGIIFGLSAGFLLYVSLSDIIPSIHENHNKKSLFDLQPILLIGGVLLVAVATMLVHA